MSQLVYRELLGHEAELLGRIDRSERVDGVYRCVGGALLLDRGRGENVSSWPTSELARLVSRLQALITSGGHAYGAWDAAEIVGMAALDMSGVNGDGAMLQLDMLYVSAGYRRRGIGRQLMSMVASRARSCGADSLYISATPTRNTVDAYTSMGAMLLSSPDPELLAKEPEDIHLILRIR